jgi:hypothetical protein
MQMELFRTNNKVQRFAVKKDIVAIQEQLMDSESLIKEMSENSSAVIYSTRCINKAINDVNYEYISGEVLSTVLTGNFNTVGFQVLPAMIMKGYLLGYNTM